MKWFRVYSEIKDDPKMLELDDHQFRLWINLLAIASEEGVTSRDTGVMSRGYVRASRRKGLAAALRTDVERLDEALNLFAELDMIDYDETDQTISVVNWDARQYDKPSDTPAATRERKKRSRQRHADVTPSHATEAEAEAEADPERDLTTPAAPAGVREQYTNSEREGNSQNGFVASGSEHRVVDLITDVPGMEDVDPADVLSHFRIVSEPKQLSEQDQVYEALKFRDYWTDKRSDKDGTFRNWKNALTSWFQRIDTRQKSTRSPPRRNNPNAALQDYWRIKSEAENAR